MLLLGSMLGGDKSLMAPPDDWDFADLGMRDTQYLTHFFHHWTAKFIPQIPGRVIEIYGRPGGAVLDPFMGCGTTLVEAALRGHPAYGLDISPLAHKIARAKTRPVDDAAVESVIAWLDRQKRRWEAARQTYGGPREDEAADETLFSGSERWFRPDVARALRTIRDRFAHLEPDTRNFVEVGLSDLLKGMSNARMDTTVPTLPPTPVYLDKKHYHRPVDNRSRRINPHARLSAQLKRMHRALQEFRRRAGATPCQPILADARRLSEHVPPVQVAVTSPPYWDAQNYQKLHSLSFRVLGLPEPGAAEIGRVKPNYLADMDQVIAELCQVLRGVFALVIGESKNGEHAAVRDLCLKHGMKEIETIRRQVVNHAFFAKAVKAEYIYLFTTE